MPTAANGDLLLALANAHFFNKTTRQGFTVHIIPMVDMSTVDCPAHRRLSEGVSDERSGLCEWPDEDSHHRSSDEKKLQSDWNRCSPELALGLWSKSLSTKDCPMIEATISRRSILTMTAALAWLDEPLWAQESKGSAGAFLVDLRSRLITVVAVGRPRPRGDDPAVAIIVEAFDIPAIEHIVLGRDASAIGETLRERLALVLAYRAGVNLFVHAEDARGTETEVLDERPAERDTVVVTTRSAAPGKEAVTIRWRLRREGRRFRVVDVMQTGRSLAQSERASWEAALRRNHGDIGAAITDLEVDPRYGH